MFWFGFFQLQRLKLRRNNWDSDTFEFDEVLTKFASQKRVYEVVAKPVVEVINYLHVSFRWVMFPSCIFESSMNWVCLL